MCLSLTYRHLTTSVLIPYFAAFFFVPFLFFFHTTPPTEIYTLSLHDALPISNSTVCTSSGLSWCRSMRSCQPAASGETPRSEEHTSELQSRGHLVCRLLLEKKKK